MILNNISLSLNAYNGVWDQFSAGHLLRRSVFGPTFAEVNQAISLGLNSTISHLFESTPAKLELPINYFRDDEPNTPMGQPWIDSDYTTGMEYVRKDSFRAWRMGNMLNQEMTIHQKLELFWFNHFAIETEMVGDTRGVHELSTLFYEQGLGSFKTLVEKVTVSQSMLIYLNGHSNTANKPNENYARELFELFTVGKGPLIAEGDYTHYSEQDIQQAAKVLSGFKIERNPKKVVSYEEDRHNKETKQFSKIFGNREIQNKEEEEYKELIDMIFESHAAPRHICRKLYRWFVYYDITDDIETNIIEPLAQVMVDNNFEVKPVLEKLLSSEHFFDMNFRGVQIKSPIDYTIGFQRQLEVEFPSKNDYESLYKLWMQGFISASNQLQSISDPPDVAGWKAYYQEPTFYRIWISSVTLIERKTFSEQLLVGGYAQVDKTILVDPFQVFEQFVSKDDPNEVVRQFTELFLPVEISEYMKDELKETLIPGLPDFEWTVEYLDYVRDKGHSIKRNAIRSKLLSLIRAIKNLPQFQLN